MRGRGRTRRWLAPRAQGARGQCPAAAVCARVQTTHQHHSRRGRVVRDRGELLAGRAAARRLLPEAAEAGRVDGQQIARPVPPCGARAPRPERVALQGGVEPRPLRARLRTFGRRVRRRCWSPLAILQLHKATASHGRLRARLARRAPAGACATAWPQGCGPWAAYLSGPAAARARGSGAAASAAPAAGSGACPAERRRAMHPNCAQVHV